jgi:type IV pilus assembly protein PilM
MNLFGGETNVFGLDIGTTGIRVVQLRGAGLPKSLVTYGGVAIDPKLTQSDAPADRKRLGDIIKKLLSDARVSTDRVVVGMPSAKVFSTVVDLPNLSHQELEQSIHYQAEQYVPMPLDKVKLDWSALGPSPEGSDKQEVLLVAAPNNQTETLLAMLESIGLEVVAIEPDSVGLIRSLIPATYTGASILLDLGAHSTDLIVTYAGSPRLVRAIAVGGETLIKSAAQNLNIDHKQAAQFVAKFGLTQSKLEGQVFKALKSSVDSLIDDIQKSEKFFAGRYKQVKIEKVILSGGASQLPEFPLYLANTVGLPVEIGNAWSNVGYDAGLHDTLLSISSQFAVAVGLALRESAA